MEKLLIEAAARGDTNEVMSLLESGSKIDVRDESGTTALMEAAKSGHLDTVTLLLDHGADVNAKNHQGTTALTLAACSGNTQIVVCLLDRGADVDASDEQESTALLRASAWGQSDVVQVLLERGADVNRQNLLGTSALMRAAKHRHANLIGILVAFGGQVDAKKPDGSTALMSASSDGHSAIVEGLLQAGAQVDLRDAGGNTPLMRAALNGHQDAVSILLASGADPYAKGKNGSTPLAFAAVSGHADVVRSLLEWQDAHSGRDRLELQTDDHGDFPLILAARLGQFEVIRLLVESLGGDLNSGSERDLSHRQLNGRNKKGDTALIEAARQGYFEIAQLLLKKGADPNTKNLVARTPLMFAAIRGDCRLVNLLLEKGADSSLKDTKGETAYGLTYQKGYTDILFLLKERKGAAHAGEPLVSDAEWETRVKGDQPTTLPPGVIPPIILRDDQLDAEESSGDWFSRSDVMRATFSTARLASEHDSAILLLGESGSGKDFLAQYIHNHSTKASGPFRSINCAALPRELAESELFGHEKGTFTGATGRRRGIFELAQGGTLFLNEIGDMPLELQTKLLTFLDTHHFQRVGGEKEIESDTRIIAATNKDLKREVAAKRFRLDLYHRLAVWLIKVPPLRERVEDIPLLARALISDLCAKKGRIPPKVSRSALGKLCSCRWEGNVRELKNVLERALILSNGNSIDPEHIRLDEAYETASPQQSPSPPPIKQPHIRNNSFHSPLNNRDMKDSEAPSRKRPPRPDIERLRSVYETYILKQAWPRARLAKYLGVESSTLKKWFKEAGLPAGQPGRPKKKPDM